MAHHCKYFVVHCMDFRFQGAIFDYLDKNGWLHDCDVVSIAGGVKDADYLLGQLDISIKLHGTEEAMLINHIDCGAYGGSEQFSSLDAEYDFQRGELKRIQDRIIEKYPAFKVRTVIARENTSGEITFEEV